MSWYTIYCFKYFVYYASSVQYSVEKPKRSQARFFTMTTTYLEYWAQVELLSNTVLINYFPTKGVAALFVELVCRSFFCAHSHADIIFLTSFPDSPRRQNWKKRGHKKEGREYSRLDFLRGRAPSFLDTALKTFETSARSLCHAVIRQTTKLDPVPAWERL